MKIQFLYTYIHIKDMIIKGTVGGRMYSSWALRWEVCWHAWVRVAVGLYQEAGLT